MEYNKNFNYKEFKRWWEQYKKDEIEESKRRDEIIEAARIVLMESEKFVEEWKEGMISRSIAEERQKTRRI